MALARNTATRQAATAPRAAGGWGLTFTVLLLVGAGMASVPGGSDPTSSVRDFYTAHAGVVVTAQVVELMATAAFVPFTLMLRRVDGRLRIGGLEAAGLAVAGAAALTAVPPLWLTAVSTDASSTRVHQLAVASDLADVVLFVAIAAFSGALAGVTDVPWFRVLSGVVAILSVVRAVELLVDSQLLEVVAPVAFVALVVVLSVLVLLRRSPVPPR